MKTAILFIFLLTGLCAPVQAQNTKILLAKKVDFDEMSEQQAKKTDRELKQEMDTFLGFGLKIGIDNVDETIKLANEEKRKSALRFQIGLQLPKFIKTNPPDKVFKVGWDFGVVK